jgi:cellulose synthase/poly-beta-1,6-N-acetylglucosamine synthase-like glycosyltransferase
MMEYWQSCFLDDLLILWRILILVKVIFLYDRGSLLLNEICFVKNITIHWGFATRYNNAITIFIHLQKIE